jgi:hypothetical protein
MKEILLNHGKIAIVDDEDYDRLMAMGKWHYNNGYAIRSAPYKTSLGKWSSKTVFMHRIIMDAPKEMEVDHRWGDTLDNRKENLRLCTHQQNVCNRIHSNNTSGFKGVSWHKRDRKWQAKIKFNGIRLHLGYFNDKIEAARVYNAAALQYQGEFAKLNQIPALP